MTFVIENELLEARFKAVGGELIGLKEKETGIEYLWQGNPEFWGRQAPVLFPFVGRLKDDLYTHKGVTYPMSQHGFARDKVFTVTEKTNEKIVFRLKSSDETKVVYPFDFELFLIYELTSNWLECKYEVRNTGDDKMYFSIGGHPAFNVPLNDEGNFEDYYLHFSPKKSRLTLPLEGPLVDLEKKTLGQTNTDIALTRELFSGDALIFETVGSNSYTIKSEKSPHSVKVSYEGMPFVGIWSPYPKEAPFVCIEPWCGIADTVVTSGNLEDKFGINLLEVGDVFKQEYHIAIGQ